MQLRSARGDDGRVVVHVPGLGPRERRHLGGAARAEHRGAVGQPRLRLEALEHAALARRDGAAHAARQHVRRARLVQGRVEPHVARRRRRELVHLVCARLGGHLRLLPDEARNDRPLAERRVRAEGDDVVGARCGESRVEPEVRHAALLVLEQPSPWLRQVIEYRSAVRRCWRSSKPRGAAGRRVAVRAVAEETRQDLRRPRGEVGAERGSLRRARLQQRRVGAVRGRGRGGSRGGERVAQACSSGAWKRTSSARSISERER